MAGNTRLLGFGVAKDKDDPLVVHDIVTLQRWGEKAVVVLQKEAIEALRRACFQELPLRPPEHRNIQGFQAEYDEATGRVLMMASPLVAKQLAELLRLGINEVKEENAKLGETAAGQLEEAYQADIDYHHVEGEPGTEQ